MITTTCSYCGTTYFDARSNCENCGAALPPLLDQPTGVPAESSYIRSAPPMPPRPIPPGYLLRRMTSDAGAIIGLVFSILGITFVPAGISMTLGMEDYTDGWILGLFGLAFLLSGPALLLARLASARRRVDVLRDGQATLGRIETLRRDSTTEINGRSPWVLDYSFNVLGRTYQGKLLTLRDPDPDLRRNTSIYVLYDPARPDDNTLYLDL